jgi:hypothetical protein
MPSRLLLAEFRAGTDPRRVPDAHPVNTDPVRARGRPRRGIRPRPAAVPALIEALSLVEHATAVVGDDGPYERARQRRRERRTRSAIPEWFSAEDLIAPPWESAAESVRLTRLTRSGDGSART